MSDTKENLVLPRHAAESTQEAFPWRTVARTLLQAILGLGAMLPVIVGEVDGAASIPWVAMALTVTGTVTRIMALPEVNAWLGCYLPFLAPESR